MVKKVSIVGVIISLLLSMLTYGFAAPDDRIAVELDGTQIEADAHIEEGNVYLPLRMIGEALGYKIQWSEKDNMISVSKPGKNILIDLKNNKIDENGHVYNMYWNYSGTAANGGMIVGDSTYMGEGFFSDNFGLKVLWDRQNAKVKLESAEENKISIKTVKEDSENDKIKITIQYPQIDGLDDKAVQDSINSIFKEAAMDSKNQGLQNTDYIKDDTAGYTASPNKYETYFDYRLKYNQNGLLSVVLLNYQYTGGAHGSTVQSSHTFNLKTGEEYNLKGLIKDETDYVSFISNAVRNGINERVKAGILNEIAPFEAIKDDQDFYLSSRAVVVYFQQYEYFPYVAGIQEFPVDFSALKDMLKPELNFLSSSGVPESPGNENAPFYGSKVAYAAEDGLYCVNMDGGEAALLVEGTGISTPAFSSDGKTVAFMQDGDLYAYDFAASKARILMEGADSFCPGKNDEFYVSSQKAGIVAISSKTAESSTIVPAESDTLYTNLKLSPDSKLLAYDSIVYGMDNMDKGGTWLYNTESKETRMIVKVIKTDSTSIGDRPKAGKWSPDSGKLFIWIMPQSASISADGVSMSIYDVADGKLTKLNSGGLAYDENVSFADPTTFAVISGGGRMMFEGKSISLFNIKNGQSEEILETPGKVTTTPCYSADGKRLVFAASPAAKTGDDYKNQADTISKRQIYMYTEGKLSAMTNDDAYRSEAAAFLKNNNYIVFARVNADGEKSVWVMDGDGNNQKLLATWKYSDPNAYWALDFYGRIDWNDMFAVFDNTKE